MPRGGKRAGAGRPKGSCTTRTREIADAAMANPEITTPLDHLLKTLNNPLIGAARKDKVAELLLPYLHPRLSATAMLNANGNNGNNNDTPNGPPVILAIPRGCFLSAEQVADPEQLVPHGVPLEPFAPTPDWTRTALIDKRDQPVVERLEVTEIDTSNVVRLGRRDDDQDGGPDAA